MGIEVAWPIEPDRPPKEKTYTTKLSKTEIKILGHYQSLGKRFECSVEDTAAAVNCGVATVHRTNSHLAALGMLSWHKGVWQSRRSHTNRYQLDEMPV
jgi:hypothetical protein